MSTTNISTNTQLNASIEPINDDYEFIQYNSKLRLIHSKRDDMFQMNSIISSCNSKKQSKDWFKNQSTNELINELMGLGEKSHTKNLYENRPNLSNELKGTYIHRLLVNHVAIWCSPKYSIYIMKLLDSLFEKEREELKNKVEEQKPRMVPENHEHEYKYLIWKEKIPDDDENIKLHLVRRHKSNFRQINIHFKNPEENWFFKDNLPIAMSPNKDIKNIIKKSFKGDDYSMNGCEIIIKIKLLDELKNKINNYFNEMQK